MIPARRDTLIGIVLYPGATLLDVAGPLQVLARLGTPFRPVLVAARHTPTATDAPVALAPHHTFGEAAEPAALLVPGGGLGTIKAMVDQELQAYLATGAPAATTVAAIGTGSLVLASAGLLEDRRATTHWGHAGYLERLGAHYDPSPVVADGRFLTAASSVDGIEMAFRLVARLVGDDTANALAADLGHVPPPSPHGAAAAALHARPLAHLPRREALGRLAAMRLVLAARPDLLERLRL
jgi:transcriptional regulator GlxA family with amidase domain